MTPPTSVRSSPLVRWLVAPLALLLAGCTIATPLRQGGAPSLAPASETAVVAVTRATVADGRAERAAFDAATRSVVEALPRAPGLLAYSVRRELFGPNAWTLTVWASEADRASFVASSPHREAMARSNTLVGARFVRFERPRALGAPSWDEALERLERDGRGY